MIRRFLKERWKLWLGVMVATFGLLQLGNPRLSNPTVTPGHDMMARNSPPAEVAAMLHEACYDCHSYETRWPWYSHVAPVSWWVAGHVEEGRNRVNFSEWPHERPDLAGKKWSHISDAVDGGDMPLRSYTWIHRGARLSASQQETLVSWAEERGKELLKGQGKQVNP